MPYAINQTEVSHNAFDDETIVIHFTTGNYFSLRGVASAIWQRLEKHPVSTEEIVGAFSDATPEAAAEIEHFIATLAKNKLVCEVSNDTNTEPVESLGAYATPQVDVFDDMQGMLLGDVIHDTDEAGWPKMAQ